MIDQIIVHNRHFVAEKKYEQYLTDKNPDKRLAVLSCIDTRLTELLPAALGLRNGDAKIIKNAGGLVISAFDSAIKSPITNHPKKNSRFTTRVPQKTYLLCEKFTLSLIPDLGRLMQHPTKKRHEARCQVGRCTLRQHYRI